MLVDTKNHSKVECLTTRLHLYKTPAFSLSMNKKVLNQRIQELTKKLPITKAVRKNRKDAGLVARMLSYSGSIHSPHNIRNIIIHA